jgi:hypothetical protein
LDKQRDKVCALVTISKFRSRIGEDRFGRYATQGAVRRGEVPSLRLGRRRLILASVEDPLLPAELAGVMPTDKIGTNRGG